MKCKLLYWTLSYPRYPMWGHLLSISYWNTQLTPLWNTLAPKRAVNVAPTPPLEYTNSENSRKGTFSFNKLLHAFSDEFLSSSAINVPYHCKHWEIFVVHAVTQLFGRLWEWHWFIYHKMQCTCRLSAVRVMWDNEQSSVYGGEKKGAKITFYLPYNEI